MTNAPPTLVSITALARSGADGLAWRLFERSGLADRRDDPAALALKGRLLKDRALGLAGQERQRAACEAAEAYAAATRLRPATYPLINAATLSLIAGCPVSYRPASRQAATRPMSVVHVDQRVSGKRTFGRARRGT